MMINPSLWQIAVVVVAIMLIAVMLKADKDYVLAEESAWLRIQRSAWFIFLFCSALWMLIDQHRFDWPVPFSHFIAMIGTAGLLLNNYISLNKRKPPTKQTDGGLEQLSADGFPVPTMRREQDTSEIM